MIESQRQLFKNKGNNNFNYEFECINNHSFDFLKNENNIIHREKDRSVIPKNQQWNVSSNARVIFVILLTYQQNQLFCPFPPIYLII